MGCLVSTAKDGGGKRRRRPARDGGSNRRRPARIGEVAVFVPGLRIPKRVDCHHLCQSNKSEGLLDRLSALRARVVAMASQEAPSAMRPQQRAATHHGGSPLSDLLQALEDYLPVLLGLIKDGSQLEDEVQFKWINHEDDKEQTSIANAWYEILSVLHLMAMLCFLEANALLVPRSTVDVYQPSISEGGKRIAIDVLLKGAGYLNCAIQTVLTHIPLVIRRELPVDLREEVLQALCLQALGQCVDIQLGMAIDSSKATLSVKRRLACEMMKCWHQAEDSISQISFTGGWGEKHHLFVKWKALEAKAAAYYYHGLILDEGNMEKSHSMAVAALQTADKLLKASKRASETFHIAAPSSRSPPLSGSMKYLHEKIPKDASYKAHVNLDLYTQERTLKTTPLTPTLPDFVIALKPDEYELPPPDAL